MFLLLREAYYLSFYLCLLIFFIKNNIIFYMNIMNKLVSLI